ncbi:MAG TPA: hypothetical protein VNT01_02035 [Symbiobacteriaceae bacterium]|nr:hypothetical protein [Symbiobacteriaceae bacterium]
MGRLVLFLAIMMVLLFGSNRLGAATPLVILLLAFGGIAGPRLLRRRAAPVGSAEPVVVDEATALRVEEACRRAGLSHLRIRVVWDNGAVLKDGVLQIAPVTAALWTDDELMAMVQLLAATPDRYPWRLYAEMYWPWGYVAALCMLLFPFVGVLAVLLVLLCVVAQGWRSTSGRPLTPRLTGAHFAAYLARGGNGPDYIRACAKLTHARLWGMSRQDLRGHQALIAWAGLRLMAGMCGISEGDLKVMIEQATGSPEIFESVTISRWQLMRPFRPYMIGAAVLLAFVATLVWAVASMGRIG